MKTSPSRNALLGVLGSTAALTALIAVALARGDGNNAPAPAAATSAQPNTSSPGMTIARDPVTGELRAPTPEEMAVLQQLQPKRESRKETDKARPRVERRADGVVVITSDDSDLLYSVATLGADGKVQRACVPSDRVAAVLAASQNGNQKKKETLDEK